MTAEDKFDLEKFAEDMSQPWECCRCKRTFNPTPDDGDSFPVAMEVKKVPAGKNWPGEFLQKKVGDICADCMRSPKPAAGGPAH